MTITVVEIREDRCHQCLQTRECAELELPWKLVLCHQCMGPFLVGQFKEPKMAPALVSEDN
jgi:hypothetical protein